MSQKKIDKNILKSVFNFVFFYINYFKFDNAKLGYLGTLNPDLSVSMDSKETTINFIVRLFFVEYAYGYLNLSKN